MKSDNNKGNSHIWPQSEEGEKALLGCMIIGGDREQEIGMAWIRDEGAFYFNENKVVWKALKELYKNGIEIDFITLTDKVKDMTGESMAYYITGLADFVPTTSNVEQYARIVWEKYIQRETARSANTLVNASYDDYTKVDSMLEKHSRLITELREILELSSRRSLLEADQEEAEHLQQKLNKVPLPIWIG